MWPFPVLPYPSPDLPFYGPNFGLSGEIALPPFGPYPLIFRNTWPKFGKNTFFDKKGLEHSVRVSKFNVTGATH